MKIGTTNRFHRVALSALCWSVAFAAWAGNVQSPTVTLTVPTLQASSINTLSVVMTAPTVADYDAGFVQSSAATVLTIKSNVSWKLSVRESDGAWNSAPWAKPLSEFQWKLNSSGTWNSITGSDVVVLNNQTAGGSQVVTIDYRILLSWANDPPGTYAVTLVYTLAPAP